MRKNRKTSNRMSVITERALLVAGVIVALFGMVILNILADSSCKQLMKSIGEKEKLLGKLEESRQREDRNWEEMISTEKLERQLVRHGLSMRYPKPAQIVKMRTDGTPQPGQFSLARAAARIKTRNVAYVAPQRGAKKTPTAKVRR